MNLRQSLSVAALAALSAPLGLQRPKPVKINRPIDPLPPGLLRKLEVACDRAEHETILKARAKRERKVAARAARK